MMKDKMLYFALPHSDIWKWIPGSPYKGIHAFFEDLRFNRCENGVIYPETQFDATYDLFVTYPYPLYVNIFVDTNYFDPLTDVAEVTLCDKGKTLEFAVSAYVSRMLCSRKADKCTIFWEDYRSEQVFKHNDYRPRQYGQNRYALVVADKPILFIHPRLYRDFEQKFPIYTTRQARLFSEGNCSSVDYEKISLMTIDYQIKPLHRSFVPTKGMFKGKKVEGYKEISLGNLIVRTTSFQTHKSLHVYRVEKLKQANVTAHLLYSCINGVWTCPNPSDKAKELWAKVI